MKGESEKNESLRRRKRVLLIKKLIVILVIVLIVVPIILCGILFAKLNKVENKLDNLLSMKENGKIVAQEDKDTGEVSLVYAMEADIEETEQDLTDTEENIEKPVVYLTFDDGPSEMTNTILDILKSYNVKATFFVNGRTDEASLAAYKRIVEEGHALGIHTYSHDFSIVYDSVDKFSFEIIKLRQLLLDTTGKDVTLFRFPGGSSTTKIQNGDIYDYINYLNEEGYIYFDWNVSSGDSTVGGISAEEIINNIISNVQNYQTPVVLMHDSVEKQTTIDALPEIIEKLLEMGYVLEAIDDSTTPVQQITEN